MPGWRIAGGLALAVSLSRTQKVSSIPLLYRLPLRPTISAQPCGGPAMAPSEWYYFSSKALFDELIHLHENY